MTHDCGQRCARVKQDLCEHVWRPGLVIAWKLHAVSPVLLGPGFSPPPILAAPSSEGPRFSPLPLLVARATPRLLPSPIAVCAQCLGWLALCNCRWVICPRPYHHRSDGSDQSHKRRKRPEPWETVERQLPTAAPPPPPPSPSRPSSSRPPPPSPPLTQVTLPPQRRAGQ